MNDNTSNDKAVRYVLPVMGGIFFFLGVAIAVKGANLFGEDPNLGIIVTGVACCISGVGCIHPDTAQKLVKLFRLTRNEESTPTPPPVPELDTEELENIAQKVERHGEIIGAVAEAPPPDEWYTRLRPVLHQVAQYTSPTYYLDVNYHIVDWNIAFELVFSRITNVLRGKHVNWLIAQLANAEEVFAHAQQFSVDSIPLVDTEQLDYKSRRYGNVQMLKVAFQLHDEAGEYRGWAVTLMIENIAWDHFENDLRERLNENKLWSVYAGSYDAVLTQYPDYQALIDKVIAIVPEDPCSVVDLGAGTGNVTQALLDKGHTVTALENNDGMLDRFRARDFSADLVQVVKSSVENLGGLKSSTFDAAVMVNVLYAVDDPLACLQEVNRILKQGGRLGFSTTHRDTVLPPLLDDIERTLRNQGKLDELADDFQNVRDANERLEDIALRHSRDDYLGWVRTAGFEVENLFRSEYQGVVMVVHARKVHDIAE